MLLAGRVLATVIAVIVLLTGCASTRESPAPPPAPAPTTSVPAPTTAAAADLARAVVSPDDIPLAGFLPPTVEPLAEDAVEGVTAFFDSQDGSHQLALAIVLLPDADAARTAMEGAARTTREQRPGATASPVSAGDAAVIITGYRSEGTASTLLLLSQGTASVAMDFRSPADDPTPPDVAIQAGVRQAARLEQLSR